MTNGEYFKKRAQLMAPILIKALENRQFEAYYCDTAQQAVEKAIALIPQGASVSWGGSETLRQIGLLEAVKQGSYVAYDRDAVDSLAERKQVMRQAFQCEYYLTGTNALTEDGQLVNMDGGGNRVAALT